MTGPQTAKSNKARDSASTARCRIRNFHLLTRQVPKDRQRNRRFGYREREAAIGPYCRSPATTILHHEAAAPISSKTGGLRRWMLSRRSVHSEGEAFDAVQSAYLAAFKHFRNFRGDAQFKA